jgi:hypothetical protein
VSPGSRALRELHGGSGWRRGDARAVLILWPEVEAELPSLEDSRVPPLKHVMLVIQLPCHDWSGVRERICRGRSVRTSDSAPPSTTSVRKIRRQDRLTEFVSC